MKTKTTPDAVRHELQVALPPEQAFALFTRGISRWWPFDGHSCSGDQALGVEFEERVGGAVTEIARDGSRFPWGTVTAWEPPGFFEMTWHPAHDAVQATCLSVRFLATGGGCRVALCHDGWAARGAEAEAVRDGYQQGWALVLGLFAAAAAQENRP